LPSRLRTTILLVASAVGLLAPAGITGSATARATMTDVRLLATYEPVMQFDPLEQFLPTKVQSFITDSDLEQLTDSASWSVVQPNAAPGDLPGPGTGTWRLNQGTCTPAASLGGLACYAAAGNQGSGGPTVYGRVAREAGEIVLQYWFFYYDDVYSYTYPPSDFIWQAHEGDWENVDVVLSGDDEPLYAGYSQHCLGERRAWSETPRFDDTHPVVHIALGSHANYFEAGTHAINTDCIPNQARAIFQPIGPLPPPVDRAFAGPIAGPPGSGGRVTPIEQIGDNVPDWVRFPGFWGELQYFHAPAPIGTVAFGASPVGPAFHREWTDPLGTLATWLPG
jgi:hypothetical protein